MKASNPTARTYRLTISQLGIEPDLTTPSASLTDVIALAEAFVPTMESYAKVYGEIQRDRGVYAQLYKFEADDGGVRHVTVRIVRDPVLQRIKRVPPSGKAPGSSISRPAKAAPPHAT